MAACRYYLCKKKRQHLLFLKTENSEIISIIPNDRTKIWLLAWWGWLKKRIMCEVSSNGERVSSRACARLARRTTRIRLNIFIDAKDINVFGSCLRDGSWFTDSWISFQWIRNSPNYNHQWSSQRRKKNYLKIKTQRSKRTREFASEQISLSTVLVYDQMLQDPKLRENGIPKQIRKKRASIRRDFPGNAHK
jgi:hypothetical protein